MDEERTTTETDGASALKEALVRLFNSHMSEVLDILSARFPHTRGDNSQNEVEFQGLRSKVLRSGNNKIRSLPEILKDYQIVQVYDTVVIRRKVDAPFKTKE